MRKRKLVAAMTQFLHVASLAAMVGLVAYQIATGTLWGYLGLYFKAGFWNAALTCVLAWLIAAVSVPFSLTMRDDSIMRWSWANQSAESDQPARAFLFEKLGRRACFVTMPLQILAGPIICVIEGHIFRAGVTGWAMAVWMCILFGASRMLFALPVGWCVYSAILSLWYFYQQFTYGFETSVAVHLVVRTFLMFMFTLYAWQEMKPAQPSAA